MSYKQVESLNERPRQLFIQAGLGDSKEELDELARSIRRRFPWVERVLYWWDV